MQDDAFDNALRRDFQNLKATEAAGAPGFEKVLGARMPRPSSSRRTVGLRYVFAFAAAAVIFLAVWVYRAGDETPPWSPDETPPTSVLLELSQTPGRRTLLSGPLLGESGGGSLVRGPSWTVPSDFLLRYSDPEPEL